jgi:hypothetical protein
VNCPSCGAELSDGYVDRAAATVRCASCGHEVPLPAPASAELRVEPPAGTRVVIDRSRPGEIALSIPGRGGLFLMILASVWVDAATVAIVLALVWRSSTFVWILVPLWLVGLGVLVAGLFLRFGVTGLRLDRREFVITRRLFGCGWPRRGLMDQVTAIELRKAFEHEDGPVMAVTICAGRKSHFVGSFLTDAEKRWIVGELRTFLAEIGRPLDEPRFRRG